MRSLTYFRAKVPSTVEKLQPIFGSQNSCAFPVRNENGQIVAKMRRFRWLLGGFWELLVVSQASNGGYNALSAVPVYTPLCDLHSL